MDKVNVFERSENVIILDRLMATRDEVHVLERPTLKQLLRIDDELVQLCKLAERKA